MAELRGALPRERPYLPRLPPAELARLGMSGAVMEAPAEALPTVREEDRVEAPVAEVVDLAVADEPARGLGAIVRACAGLGRYVFLYLPGGSWNMMRAGDINGNLGRIINLR